MSIEEIKKVYAAGMEAIRKYGADRVRKHDRKRDANIFMERGDYWVSFTGPVCVHHADGRKQENVVGISLTFWHTMDVSEEGTEYFDDVKEAIRFLRSAIRNPKCVMKRIETWFEE